MSEQAPDEIRSPKSAPLDYNALSDEQLDAEIQKGVNSWNAGRVFTPEQVREYMQKLYERKA